MVPMAALSTWSGCRSTVVEALHDQEEQAFVVELGDGVVEVEVLEDLAHVGAEAGDVVAQVGGEVGRVGEQGLEVVEGGVVEGVAGGAAQLGVEVVEFAVELGVGLQDLLSLVGARTQSRRRRTVRGRMTSWYLPRLKVSRMMSAMPQRKPAIWLLFIGVLRRWLERLQCLETAFLTRTRFLFALIL